MKGLDFRLYIIEHFGSKCAYCQTAKFDVIDHITALKHGGGNTANNIVPACYECNARKDRKGQIRDYQKIDAVTQKLHMFLVNHGPFSPIEEETFKKKHHVRTIYYVSSQSEYDRMKAMGREVRFLDFKSK